MKHQAQLWYKSFLWVLCLGLLSTADLFARRSPTKASEKVSESFNTLHQWVPSIAKKIKLIRDEHSNVIIGTKLLQFNEDISNAWNPSIAEQEHGHLLIMRYETTEKWCNKCGLTKQYINMVHLDRNFEQISPIKKISTNSHSAEDARVHYWRGQSFLTYNDDTLEGHSDPWKRSMYLAKLDIDNARLSDIKPIPSGGIPVTPIEKNWVPFEYNGSLYYIYSTSPYKIIQIDDMNNSISLHHSFTVAENIDRIWDKNFWGEIRGGSPARLVDDVYITFFHSWKYSPRNKNYYYVMGAYTFQARPPFKILAMTPEPIVFKEMYFSKHKVRNVHTLYPGGFAIEKKDGKTILHVACGENDISVRIVSIDKDALIKSMTRLE